MKFALKLDANKYSDWPYVDYKGLKRLLKDRSVAPLQNGSVPSTPTSLGLKHLQAPLLEHAQQEEQVQVRQAQQQLPPAAGPSRPWLPSLPEPRPRTRASRRGSPRTPPRRPARP